MAMRAGIWIDHRKAVIVRVADEATETKSITSHAERHVRYSGGAMREPEDTRERRFEAELVRFYDEVIAGVRDAESILILGPGEAKGEFRARLAQLGHGDRIAAVEAADKMTDRQIAARARTFFAATPGTGRR